MSWPPHALVLRTPRLTLRGLTEQLALELAQVLPADVELDPALMLGDRAVGVLQAYSRTVATWSREDWVLPFAVCSDEGLVGLQGLEGKQFAVRREAETHSWLVPAARGRGIGREMRAAVLGLAFGPLGATRAVTEAWADNAASLGVSRSLGYVPNGTKVVLRGGVPDLMVGMVLTDPHLPPVDVSGLEPCLPLLGLA